MAKRPSVGFQQRLEAYRKTYEIDDATNPNDIANLHVLITNQQLIDTLQGAVDSIMASDDLIDQIGNIKKLQDARQGLIDQNMSLERLLGIDRKSRKRDTQESVADYILFLKESAKEFLDQQLINVTCPSCRVLVGRVLPAHEHTEFFAEFQCSQCKKYGTVRRKERDVFFDLKEKNKEWRKKYPVEIVQPGKKDTVPEDDSDIFLEDSDALENIVDENKIKSLENEE